MSTVEPKPVEPKLLSVDQTAHQLAIGKTTLFALLNTGALKSLTIGRRRLIPVTALEQFIKENTH